MKTARIILTRKCNRACHYCCNEKTGPDASINKAIKVASANACFKQFDSVVLTGGEPMLYWRNVITLASVIKWQKDIPIFLQTALYTKHLKECMQWLDGITYTVHQETTSKDTYNFLRIQELALSMPEKSFRLNVHQDTNAMLLIDNAAWNEVRFFTHKEDCPIPANEILMEI